MGWGEAFGLSQFKARCWEGFLLCFFLQTPADWGCSPDCPHPCSYQCVAMPGWHLHPSAHVPASAAPSCQSERPMLSQRPHGMPGWVALVLAWGISLPSLSLQWHLCHQVRGLMPELCQTPQPLLVLGAPCTWAKDKAQSQYVGHPPPSCHVPGVEIALPSFLPRLPSKGPRAPLPELPHWVQACWEPQWSSQGSLLFPLPLVYQTSIIS